MGILSYISNLSIPLPVADASPRPADRSAWLFEALRVRTKFARFILLYKAGFDPNQPRVPAGHPDGGQWTDTGASRFGPSVDSSAFDADFSDTHQDTGGAEEFDVAIIDGPKRYIADLEADESKPGKKLGHTIEKHVYRDFMGQKKRLDDNWEITFFEDGALVKFKHMRASGSFTGVEAANNLVTAVLQNNKEIVDAVAAGVFGRRPVPMQKYFGRVTGWEAYRRFLFSSVKKRSTYSVRVVIRYAPQRERGYYVLTAYPTNESFVGHELMDMQEKAMNLKYIPFTFTTFVTALDMELYEHEGADRRDIRPFIDAVIDESTEKDNIDLKGFLDDILGADFTDAQMETLWQKPGPMYQFSLGSHRAIFTYARDKIGERYAKQK